MKRAVRRTLGSLLVVFICLLALPGGGLAAAPGDQQGPLTFQPDTVPPKTTFSVTPAAGSSGWISYSATVTLKASDRTGAGGTGSGVDFISATADGIQQVCPAGDTCSFRIAAGGRHTVTYHATDKAGNIEADHAFQVQVDADDPSITGGPDRAPNLAGWYNADVTVRFICSDAGSGIASCPAPAVLGEGANQSVSGIATDKAGHVTTFTVGGINIDETAPRIAYSGNAGSYTVAETVSIACSASDSLSGLSANTCADIAGPAYTFALGTNSFSASATDVAGNSGTAAVSFTVSATAGSVCQLVKEWVSKQEIANSLCTKLKNAVREESAEVRSGLIGAFLHELEAMTEKWVSKEHAEILSVLARAL